VQTLTHEEQIAVDIKKALKESKKTSKRQPCTRGSSEGTGVSPGVLDESTVILATSSEGTESEYTKEENNDETIEWVDTNEEDEKKDEDDNQSINLEQTNDEETDDEFVHGKEHVHDDDEEITDAAKVDAEKNEEVKDDAKKAELPPTSSSLLSPSVLTILVISKTSILTPILETPLVAPATTLLPPPSASTIPPVLLQTTTPIPTPPITTEAPTITTVVPESDALIAVQLRKSYNHALYHALMEALIEDENAMDKGVADTVKNHKRQYDDDEDDDEDPSGGPNQGKKTKRRRTKESESSMKPSTTKETSKAKAPTKSSKPAPKINKPCKDTWFKQPPRPHTPDPEWNKRQIEHALLEYYMEECSKALTDRLDWNNLNEDRCPFDLTKPLPLKGCPSYLTVAAEYFFNNDLEFLKSSDPKNKYTTSITKTKAARYEIMGIKDMVPMLWSTIKVGYDKDAEKRIKH
ncbi:hypothetical protein Tco_0513811, partial [Tanacetum coccineum]